MIYFQKIDIVISFHFLDKQKVSKHIQNIFLAKKIFFQTKNNIFRNMIIFL